MSDSGVGLKRDEFLRCYNISQEDFRGTGLSWDLLESIYSGYLADVSQLKTTGDDVSQRLRQVPEVHSLRVWIKHPEHVIEKIIRKKRERPDFNVELANYSECITDPIGVRALHLFKAEWRAIHKFVLATWDLKEDPIAYIREGDPAQVRQAFEDNECKVEVHRFGYRSVHYVIKSQPTKRSHLVELQVRTIFEEGWSEIDHQIRYPYNTNNLLIAELLTIFNRLAGSADEMGSYVKTLSIHVAQQNARMSNLQEQLETTISELNISQNDKEKLKKEIDELRKSAQTGEGLGLQLKDLIEKQTAQPADFRLPRVPDFGQTMPNALSALAAGMHPGSILAQFFPTDLNCIRCGKRFQNETGVLHMMCDKCRGV
jgi:ppGpp synthetase/RelA/SpoT-type nucleotidyltranferase